MPQKKKTELPTKSPKKVEEKKVSKKPTVDFELADEELEDISGACGDSTLTAVNR